jgi:hypothetical protein
LRILPGSARSPGFPPGSLGRHLVAPVLRFLRTIAFLVALVGKKTNNSLNYRIILLQIAAFNNVDAGRAG